MKLRVVYEIECPPWFWDADAWIRGNWLADSIEAHNKGFTVTPVSAAWIDAQPEAGK